MKLTVFTKIKYNVFSYGDLKKLKFPKFQFKWSPSDYIYTN